MIKDVRIDRLRAFVFPDREALGAAVVEDVTAAIASLLREKGEINMLFAAAPSQKEVLEGLSRSARIPWEKINAFHMDEYIGPAMETPQGFGNYLKRTLFGRVPLQRVYYMGRGGKTAADECWTYSRLLEEFPLDIALLGIGENGHIAFNDPAFADFDDKEAVKIVVLDRECRRQQVNDGCFSRLEEVPETALTLTIPELIKPRFLFCTVPGKRKAPAVRKALQGDIEVACPASVLRTVDTRMYLDRESGACLLEDPGSSRNRRGHIVSGPLFDRYRRKP